MAAVNNRQWIDYESVQPRISREHDETRGGRLADLVVQLVARFRPLSAANWRGVESRRFKALAGAAGTEKTQASG